MSETGGGGATCFGTATGSSATGTASVERLAEGLWLVRFPTIETISVHHTRAVLPPLVDASLTAPLVLLVDLPPELRLVPPGMAAFWLNVFLFDGVVVKAIGVTSTSRSVRVLAGLLAAMKVRARPLAAQALPTLEELIEWGRAQLALP